jgi:hypothetical protein
MQNLSFAPIAKEEILQFNLNDKNDYGVMEKGMME